MEAIELAAGRHCILPMLAATRRGVSRPVLAEAEDMVKALIDNLNISCEAYVSPFNGPVAKCMTASFAVAGAK